MKTYTKLPADLPTEFRGVSFDDGWEFDMPIIIYKPVMIYLQGGGGEFERGVEDYLIDLANYLDGYPGCGKPKSTLSAFERKVFKWRGWSIPNLPRRKNATHYLAKVEWSLGDDGLDFTYTILSKWGSRPKWTQPSAR